MPFTTIENILDEEFDMAVSTCHSARIENLYYPFPSLCFEGWSILNSTTGNSVRVNWRKISNNFKQTVILRININNEDLVRINNDNKKSEIDKKMDRLFKKIGHDDMVKDTIGKLFVEITFLPKLRIEFDGIAKLSI